MNFKKFIVAALLGFLVWFYLDSQIAKDFFAWKNHHQSHPELIDENSDSGKWFKRLFSIDEEHLTTSKFDLHIESSENFTPKVIQEALGVSKAKAIEISKTHDYWKPIIMDSKYSDLLKPTQIFRDGGCIARIKCVELRRNPEQFYYDE